eukprot:scaffold188782_cov18-Tisochrysis_lutea.AAC.1
MEAANNATIAAQVLAWLSILAAKNANVPEGGKVVGVKDVALEHWNKFGRNFFRCVGRRTIGRDKVVGRYDYEEVATDAANKVMAQVADVISKSPKGTKMGDFTLDFADNFEYVDPIDGSKASKQGLRFVFTGGWPA